jgi:hypothetical protein
VRARPHALRSSWNRSRTEPPVPGSYILHWFGPFGRPA